MKSVLVATAVAGCLALAATASADVTGDFKVTGASYISDVATVSGSVNNGAIQSKKSVKVDVTYEYSFVAEKTEIIPGETTTTTVFVPGKCVSGIPNRDGCFDKNGNPKALNGATWTGTYTTSTTTTAPQTVTLTFNGAAGMTAITEPTIERGRLNPKGKITGYNWTASMSIVPNAALVDPALIPEGYSVISVTINSVSYAAYLVDPNGVQIADTVFTGTMPVD